MSKSVTASQHGQSRTPRRQSRGYEALADLGFSQYEARTYFGLVGKQPMTAYAVSKETQVPQPKVYETLGRLVSRGAVVQVTDSPARYVAVTPSRLLAQMDDEFRRKMSTAELEMARLNPAGSDASPVRTYRQSESWEDIAGAAIRLIERAENRLYVSGHSDQLEPLTRGILDADSRGVRSDVVCFGDSPFVLQNGAVIRHSSTDHMVYRHHQARHLAVTADADSCLWGLAINGEDWQAIWAEDDGLLSSVIKGFVRHDLFVQRIYADFSDELRERYGAGLEGLFLSRSVPASSDHASSSPAKRLA